MEDKLQTHIRDYKHFHNITGDIDNQFKFDNGLIALYNDEWISLTKRNNSFYSKATLKQHGVDFMRAVGLMSKRQIPQYQPPLVNNIREEMMKGYTQSQSLDLKRTPFSIGNFLKGMR